MLGIEPLDESDAPDAQVDGPSGSDGATSQPDGEARDGGQDGDRDADLEWSRWGVPPGSPSALTASAEIVADTSTGLTWQRGTMASIATWADAKTACDALALGGLSDWRLPTRIELASIVDYRRAAPVLAPTYFENTVLGVYWTASAFAADTSRAWGTDMTTGAFMDYAKTDSHFVKCVRGATEAPP